jgi:hypothetical protein
MLNIFRKTTENERKEENSRDEQDKFNKNIEQFNTKQDRTKNGLNKDEADLRCEEAIMKEKERYGRARNSLMKYLRAEYGRDVADRALRRINKRRTEGYFNS